MYWYYRREKIETYGHSKVLIVCDNGNGIRNFKILARNGNEIEVGFSIGQVFVQSYIIHHKDFKQYIRQTYYVLDVMSGELRRVRRINANTTFPKAFNKPVISFCSRENVNYTLFSSKKEYYVKPFDELTGEESGAYNLDWINIEELPKSIFELDFGAEKVQKVHVVTFFFK